MFQSYLIEFRAHTNIQSLIHFMSTWAIFQSLLIGERIYSFKKFPTVIKFIEISSYQHNINFQNISIAFLVKDVHFLHAFRVGETGDWNEWPIIITNNSETSYVVMDLLPFTVYSFRVLAFNQLGRSNPSKESYYICTLREKPKGKPVITNGEMK